MESNQFDKLSQAQTAVSTQQKQAYDHKPVAQMTEEEKQQWRKQVLRKTQQTMRKTKQMLQRSDETKKRCEQARKAGQDLDRKFKQFQDRFKDVLNGLAQKISSSLATGKGNGPLEKEFQKRFKIKPKAASPQEAADSTVHYILNPTQPSDKIIEEQQEDEQNQKEQVEESKKKQKRGKLIVLTGAGLSAPSGLPTFRGAGGLWSDDQNRAAFHQEGELDMNSNPMQIITQSTLQSNPLLNWNWHLRFFKDLIRCKPNPAHYAILKLQQFCKQQDIQMLLVTQNVDDYHGQVMKTSKKLQFPIFNKSKEGENNFAFTDNLVQIHGNFKFMRCNKKCQGFFQAPNHHKCYNTVQEIPKCKKCGQIMRHHCLFFDQSYENQYYQREKVQNFLEEAEVILVIGTELETGFPSKMVAQMKYKEKLVVQMNLNPFLLNTGRILNVAGGCEKTLPQFVDQFIRAFKTKLNPKPKLSSKATKNQKLSAITKDLKRKSSVKTIKK